MRRASLLAACFATPATVLVEQFSRTSTRFTGETVVRSGPAVSRTQYEITLANGKATSAVVRRRQADGSPIPNTPLEWRYTFGPDSAKRQTVWKDSTQSAAFAARNAFVGFPVYSYAPFEVIYARGAGARDSVPVLGLGGGVSVTGLQTSSGDTLRIRGGPYQMLMRFDREGRLQSTDGIFTTNKAIGTRTPGKVDIAAIAAAMKPTGM